MNSSDFREIATRGRIAYSILCLEDLLKMYQCYSQWEFVLQELWGYCSGSIADWEERMSEVCPLSVLDDVPFKDKGYEYLTNEQHDNLRALYTHSAPVLLDVVELIYEQGITNINRTINSEALKVASLPYMQKILDIVVSEGIPFPDFSLISKYSISQNRGWGNLFSRDDILGD